MKQYKYLYKQMLEEETIRKAYKNLRKGKTKRPEIQKIEADFENEVKAMRLMILNTRPVPVEHPELAYKPRKHKVKSLCEHGKKRKAHLSEIHEQWLHHIIVVVLEPIVAATAYRFSCGYRKGKGAHYGKRELERHLRKGKGIRYFAKMDIRHFYDSIKKDILMRELRIRIKDEWFLYIPELCLWEFKKGIPLGAYHSPWLANYLLEPLDRFITETLGMKIYIRYMDDIVFFLDNKKKLHKAVAEIRKFLGRRFRLKLKKNYQVCKFDYRKKDKVIGRPVDFMGFLFFRNRTTIRKRILLAATRTARKLKKAGEEKRGYFTKHIKAMLSYMGWFTHTDSYDCYRFRIKPHVNIKQLKRIISRREKRERMEKGKKRGKTGRAPAHSSRHVHPEKRHCTCGA